MLRTRKKRGGLKPQNNNLYNFTKNPEVIQQECIQHPDYDNKLYNKEPTWIQYLWAAKKVLRPKEKLAERKKWCGSKKKKTNRNYC